MALALTKRAGISLDILQNSFLKLSLDPRAILTRGKKNLNRPRLRNPTWFVRKERTIHNDFITPENQSFIKEVVHDRYGPPAIIGGIQTYQQSGGILRNNPEMQTTWTPGTRRCGVIARKIGNYPLWLKDGTKIKTTLLQVVDNHVVRYIPPEELDPPRKSPKYRKDPLRFGALVVGAESVDPSLLTKEYCGLFRNSGVMPKKVLTKFLVSPSAAINPGTPLLATHFRVGDFVDVRGKTIDRGFQGVCKRWGFKGMPASHGVTKTHRRGGNIGSGGQKARVWPGTKMPGHMGNRYRVLRGLRVWRINTKYNVLWVQGTGIAGDTNSIVYIHDTMLPLRKLQDAPPFPTCFPDDLEEPLSDEIYHEKIQPFSDPTITYVPE